MKLTQGGHDATPIEEGLTSHLAFPLIYGFSDWCTPSPSVNEHQQRQVRSGAINGLAALPPINLDAYLIQALNRLAVLQGVSLSDAIVSAICAGLQAQAQELGRAKMTDGI